MLAKVTVVVIQYLTLNYSRLNIIMFVDKALHDLWHTADYEVLLEIFIQRQVEALEQNGVTGREQVGHGIALIRT